MTAQNRTDKRKTGIEPPSFRLGEDAPSDAKPVTFARSLSAELVGNWRIIAGLALMYLWTWLIYWGGPFSLRNYTIELTNLRWGINVVMVAVSVGITLILSCRMPIGRLSAGMRTASFLCGVLGTSFGLLLAIPIGLPPAVVTPVAVCSGIFTGTCEGLLLCQWCTATSTLGVRMALSHNAAAMALGGLLFLVSNAAPVWFSLAFGMACPFLGWIVARNPTSRGSSSEIDCPRVHPNTRQDEPLKSLLRDRSFLMLAGISLLFGISNGFINAGFEIVPKSLYWFACYGVVVGTIVAAVLAFLAAFVLKMDAWQLVFRVSIPLMAASFLLLPYKVFWYVGWGVHALGYHFFFIALWSLLGSKQLRRDVPAVVSVTLGLFAAETGSALGLGLWNALCAGIDTDGLRHVASAAVFIIVLIAVSFERPRFGWGNVRPGGAPAAESLRASSYRAVLDRIRVDYGLSPRETEVCAHLGRGRNRQFVADALGISLETAKTHVTNVYRKLGVHSQQELLDVIEMVQDALSQEHSDDLR